MKSRHVMLAAAFLFAVCGLALLFAPQEVMSFLGLQGAPIVTQLLASALWGFAILDWMGKDLTIGGIYGRPIVMANLCCFTTAGLVAVRSAIGVAAVALVFAAVFFMLMMRKA